MAYNTITELNSYMRNSNCEYFNNKYITTLFSRLMNINVLLCTYVIKDTFIYTYLFYNNMNEIGVLTKEDAKKLFSGTNHNETIEKEASISWDGRNILVRIPKEISEYLNLNKENRFEKNIKFMINIKRDSVEKSFDIINRSKPKRKVKKWKKQLSV